MKKANYAHQLFLLAILLAFTACNKKDAEDTTPQAAQCILTKIVFFDDGASGGSAINLTYNSNGYVETITEVEGNPQQIVATSNFTYNPANQATRVDFTEDSGNFSGYNLYSYHTDGTLQEEKVYIDSDIASTLTYTYDASKRLVQVLEVTGGLTYKQLYEYIGNTGNISKITYIQGENKPIGSVTYEDYDDKPTIAHAVKGIMRTGMSANNPRKETIAFFGYSGSVHTYGYQYNKTGYVTEMSDKLAGAAGDSKTTYTYTGCN